MEKVRLVVVSETPLLLNGISTILGQDHRLDVIAQTTELGAGITAARRTTCDVLLVQTCTPILVATRSSKYFSADSGGTRVLVLTQQATHDELLGTLRAGVLGYAVLGHVSPVQLCNGVAALARDGIWIGPAATRLLVLEALRHGVEAEEPMLPLPSATPPDQPHLSERELAVLRLAASGEGEVQIARTLSITANTVKTYLRRICGKLETSSRAEAIRLGLQLGLVQDQRSALGSRPVLRAAGPPRSRGRSRGRNAAQMSSLR